MPVARRTPLYRQRFVEASCQPGIGPLLITILVIHFGILFWIISVITIVFMNFSQLRGVWKLEGLYGISVFEASVLITILLMILILVDVVAVRQRPTQFGWCRVISYLSIVLVVAVLGRNLYAWASIPLNDTWYYQALKDEPIDSRYVHLARIVDTHTEGCGSPDLDCVLVVVIFANR